MIIAAEFSFNRGKGFFRSGRRALLREVESIIKDVNARRCKTKESKEKTMPGKILYSPVALNKAFKTGFYSKGWENKKVQCEYPSDYYKKGYTQQELRRGAFRDMDFVKGKVGVEVQFGKYAFMVYNVCAKMTVFHNLGFINGGIEIVPVKKFADEMSTGVSYFEQFVWDLEHRGIADIDIPVLILGVDK
jgi:hypothetical protein